MKIHIVGASGSGVTTLGHALSTQLSHSYFDTDDYYWYKTDPPFTSRRPNKSKQLQDDLAKHDDFIVGGSLVGWGDSWFRVFDVVVFLWIPTELRMQRLRAREYERYGELIRTKSDRRSQSEAFLDWASHYDEPDFTSRSLVVHEKWLGQLSCPIIELRGDYTVAERVQYVLEQLPK